jgi:hypothetical protein
MGRLKHTSAAFTFPQLATRMDVWCVRSCGFVEWRMPVWGRQVPGGPGLWLLQRMLATDPLPVR